MDWVRQLQARLAEGLYVHNLRQIIECCDSGMKEGQRVLPAYVIRSVVADLQRDWEGQAVLVDEARRVESVLVPALNDVAKALVRQDQPAVMDRVLERLVNAWLSI